MISYQKDLTEYVNTLFAAHDDALLFLQGHSGAGKDTLASQLEYWLPNVSVRTLQFATPLKRTAAKLAGLPLMYFVDADKKDSTLPDCGMPRKICTEVYMTYEGKETFYPNQHEFEIDAKWTPRKLLCELGASNPYYPKTLWASLVADYIEKQRKDYIATFGEDRPRTLWVLSDLRYPHEYDVITSAFENWPKAVFYLNTDYASGVDHESDRLMDTREKWKYVERRIIPARLRVQLGYDAARIITQPKLAIPLSKEITLNTAIAELLNIGFLQDHE